MTRSDFIIEMLLELRMYSSFDEAKAAILKAFREEFPFWSFSDWDQPVSEHLNKSMKFRVKILECESLNQIIAEFDNIERLIYM